MWEIEISEIYEQKLRGFKKKHSDILQALQYNANSYHRLLNEGKNPMQFKKGGFIHPESYHSLLAVDNRHPGQMHRLGRLYLYPDTNTQTLHFITLGFKKTQPQDLKVARRYVDKLIRGE